jgi:hypothetical protein
MINRLSRIFVTLVALALATSTLPAQEKPRVSPHETVTATVDGNEMIIVYGRPYSKDPKSGEIRKIWGTLVPFGKVWRMGADEATLLTTKKQLDLGGKTIPAGTYSLFFWPEENGNGKLIVNKQTGQWGTKYDESQDLARIEMTKGTLPKAADQFAITIDKAGSGGELKMMWENTSYSVPFSVSK